MQFRIHNGEHFLTTCRTRLPFRFGISTMTWAPLATLRVMIETADGGMIEGASSDLLVPKWFKKDPNETLRDDLANLLASATAAISAATQSEHPPATAFDHWRRIHAGCAPAADDGTDRLVHGFGVALIERAMLDAVCRAAGCSFFEALRRDLFAFDPSMLHAKLAGWRLAEALPDAPLSTIIVRHTVGLLDALRERDVPDETRVNDGLPESLEADIERYGLTHFKLKLRGDADSDEARLLAIGKVLQERLAGVARFTLDGNEQFPSLADLADLLDRVAGTTPGRALLDGLLYTEQPLPRTHTFDAQRNAAVDRVTTYAPLMIDEADADIDAFRRAIELGYRGVSVKNCKGVFRALANFGLCRSLGDQFFQSSEDLTNLPLIAVQQDLTTAAALGLTHSERNGHHYFNGLSHLPQVESRAAAEKHDDLYEQTPGGPQLRISNGVVQTGSLQRPGYGYDVPIAWDQRTPAADWQFPESP